MYRVFTYGANIGFKKQNEMENLIVFLRNKGYSPVIRNMIINIYNIVNLPLPDETEITKIIEDGDSYKFPRYMYMLSNVIGDIFIKDSSIYTIIPLGGERVQVSTIGNEIVESKKPELLKEIEDAIKARFDGRRVRGMDFEWKQEAIFSQKSLRNQSHDMNEESEDDKKMKYTVPSYESEDIKIADLIENKEIRQFLIKLAQLKKITSKDVNDTINMEKIENLRSLDLIKEEKLITCKQDQHTICT